MEQLYASKARAAAAAASDNAVIERVKIEAEALDSELKRMQTSGNAARAREDALQKTLDLKRLQEAKEHGKLDMDAVVRAEVAEKLEQVVDIDEAVTVDILALAAVAAKAAEQGEKVVDVDEPIAVEVLRAGAAGGRG